MEENEKLRQAINYAIREMDSIKSVLKATLNNPENCFFPSIDPKPHSVLRHQRADQIVSIMEDLAVGNVFLTRFCNLILSVREINEDKGKVTGNAFFGNSLIQVTVDIDDIILYAHDLKSLREAIVQTAHR